MYGKLFLQLMQTATLQDQEISLTASVVVPYVAVFGA